MINEKRIVPIVEIDLISMYGFALAAAAAAASADAPEKLEASDVATFAIDTNSKTYIAAEPVKDLTFGSSVTAGTVYFIPSLDYVGFKKTGATLTVTGDVVADGRSMYKATLSTNALTITKIGY